jgi:hypothetical protein
MSGRRKHARFAIAPPAEGVVRIPRDVIVQGGVGSDLVVVSPSPGTVDELLTLELFDKGSSARLRVKVAESRPMVVEGLVRHQLRLRVVSLFDALESPPGAVSALG